MRRQLGLAPAVLRAGARLLVLTLSVVALGPMLHGVHAEACDPAFVLHDEAEHHFQAAPADPTGFPGGEHCVACHFARSSRSPVSWVSTGLASLATGNLLLNRATHGVSGPSAAPLPAR